jgi:hypothetical protein
MMRGVDIKQILIQSNSMERVQQVQQQNPEMQQRYLDIQLSEERKHHKENVRNAEETEESRISKRKEEERARREFEEQPERRKKEARGSEEKTDGEEGEHIDIRV